MMMLLLLLLARECTFGHKLGLAFISVWSRGLGRGGDCSSSVSRRLVLLAAHAAEEDNGANDGEEYKGTDDDAGDPGFGALFLLFLDGRVGLFGRDSRGL
jgi:hypothetical protein